MRRIISLFLFLAVILLPIHAHTESLVGQRDELQAQLDTKRTEIEKLELQIEQYRKDIAKNQGQATTLQSRINVLLQQIRKLNLETRLLVQALAETKLNIRKTERFIGDTEENIAEQRTHLAGLVRQLDQEQGARTLFVVFLGQQKLSQALTMVQALVSIQERVHTAFERLRALKEDLHGKKTDLEERQTEQAKLLALQEAQRREVLGKEQQHEQLLKETRQKTTKLKELVTLSAETVEELKNEIYALQKIGVTVQDAIRLGQLVAERTGVRAAFLIAVLEVESRLGLNVGRGTYTKDMNPNQHEAFLALMKELKRDPDKTPVSKKPSYGWGGAMGPAQFLPQTWNGYKAEVARLTGRSPADPWNIEDAFMASGVKLAGNGASAQTEASERRAAKIYISGNPNCTRAICNSYSNMVLDKARDIEATLKR